MVSSIYATLYHERVSKNVAKSIPRIWIRGTCCDRRCHYHRCWWRYDYRYLLNHDLRRYWHYICRATDDASTNGNCDRRIDNSLWLNDSLLNHCARPDYGPHNFLDNWSWLIVDDTTVIAILDFLLRSKRWYSNDECECC
jgi:hypothetical protein